MGPDSGRPSKIVEEVKVIVDEQMSKDDGTIAYLLYRLLVSCGYNISIHTILRCWSSLGWTFVVLPTNMSLKFMKDNDPKHTSVYVMEDKGIDWWQTLPESPDLILYITCGMS